MAVPIDKLLSVPQRGGQSLCVSACNGASLNLSTMVACPEPRFGPWAMDHGAIRAAYVVCRRTVGLAATMVLLALLSPVILIAALLAKLTSRGHCAGWRCCPGSQVVHGRRLLVQAANGERDIDAESCLNGSGV